MSAVIFDLDGVLVDSEPYWQRGFAAAANAWCREYAGSDPGLTAADMQRFQGGRVSDTMTTVLTELGFGDRLDEAEVGRLTGQVVAEVSAEFTRMPAAIEGNVALARELFERGIRLAVASSSAVEFIEAAVSAVGLEGVFEVLQSALLLEHGKPHPEVYELALARLGVGAAEASAVEDSLPGVVSALRAGLRVIWYLGPETAEDDARDRLGAALVAQDCPAGWGAAVVVVQRPVELADFDRLDAAATGGTW